MLTLVDPFTMGDITVFRDEKERDVLYLASGSLHVVMLPKGTPSFALMYLGDGATLMLETEWQVRPEKREQILDQATAIYRAKQTPRWRIVPVPIIEGKARLFLEESGAQPVLLAETSVSGYGSMRAAFSLQLQVEMAVRIERALRVDDADLTAIYELTCAAASRAAVSWEVNLGKVKQALRGTGLVGTVDEILKALPEFRESGAIIEMGSPAAISSGQKAQILRSLAEMLAGYLTRGAATGTITLTQATSEPQQLKLTPFCSLSEAVRGFETVVRV